MSGYIAITEQGNERRVAWKHSYREPGKSTPCSSALHLGVLAADGAELLRCRRRRPEDFTPEILDALSRKGIVLGERLADTVGRKPTVFTRVTVRELASSQVVMVGVYRVLHQLAASSGLLASLKAAFADDAEAVFAFLTRKSKDAIAALRFENLFKEFEADLASTVKERNRRENPNARHPGRPPKYKLKEDVKK